MNVSKKIKSQLSLPPSTFWLTPSQTPKAAFPPPPQAYPFQRTIPSLQPRFFNRIHKILRFIQHSLIWNPKRLVPLRDFQVDNHIEHGDSILEKLDGFGRVDYEDVNILFFFFFCNLCGGCIFFCCFCLLVFLYIIFWVCYVVWGCLGTYKHCIRNFREREGGDWSWSSSDLC